jgi:hypothetical protein
MNHLSGVIAGLVPAIHVLLAEDQQERRGCPRDKRGHDGGEVIRSGGPGGS